MDAIANVGISILFATIMASIGHFLKQPLLLAYILAGVVIGPVMGLGLVKDIEIIESMSHFGLILLLFLTGLEININKIKEAGKSMIISGLIQFPLTVIIGIGFFLILGYTLSNKYDLFYLAVCCALSSTAIVVKLLYSKFELDTLAGRITLGILIFQDIWAIILLGIQPNLNNPQILNILHSLFKGFLLIFVSMAISKYILPKLFKSIAKVPELVLISALAWCFFVCGIAHYSNISIEMGALIAGIAISTFPYNLDVIGKVVNIRDFFLTLFFVSLGMQIPNPLTEPSTLKIALIASVFLIFSRFIAIFPILYSSKKGLRVSLLSSINLSQMSEFSLHIAALGLLAGHINRDILYIIIFIFVITSITSNYMIKYSDYIQKKLAFLLKRVGLKSFKDTVSSEKEDKEESSKKEIAILGFHRTASSLLQEILDKDRLSDIVLKDKLIVIDFNPEVYQSLKSMGIKIIYGDISHLETFHAGIKDVKVVVSTIPDTLLVGTDNLKLIKKIKNICPEAKIIVTAESVEGAIKMYSEGADFVILPRILSSQKIMMVLELILNNRNNELKNLIEMELNMLKNRNEIIC